MEYIQANMLEPEGLRFAQANTALACMFVADQGSHNPDQEDSSTIMSVASVKAFCPRTRCIVQLLQSTAKVCRNYSLLGF